MALRPSTATRAGRHGDAATVVVDRVPMFAMAAQQIPSAHPATGMTERIQQRPSVGA